MPGVWSTKEAYSLAWFVSMSLIFHSKMKRCGPKCLRLAASWQNLSALANQKNEPSMGTSALQISICVWQRHWQSADDDESSRRESRYSDVAADVRRLLIGSFIWLFPFSSVWPRLLDLLPLASCKLWNMQVSGYNPFCLPLVLELS
jgi:hypothetical protein